jgi:hypothetical protein
MPSWEYWPHQWELIQEVQQAKRSYFESFGEGDVNHSDRYVMTNPATGRDVPVADLQYAKDHLQELYDSGEIREDRWAFLWYH